MSAATKFGLDAPGVRIDDMTPVGTGETCYFSFAPDGTDEEVYEATVMPFGVAQLTDDSLSNSQIFAGSIRLFDPAAPSAGLFFAQGTNQMNFPTDSVLRVVDLGLGIEMVIDAVPSTHHIFGVSYP